MTLKQAMKRIEELERKVAQLEARPAQRVHYHTHYAQYYSSQLPPIQPVLPQPWRWPYEITCGGSSGPVGIGMNAYPAHGYGGHQQ